MAADPKTPSVLNYRRQVDKQSMVNTPATYSWYIVSLVVQWIKDQGGLKVMDQHARQRSGPLYEYIDQSDFYHNKVDPNVRSRINVVFFLQDSTLNDAFLEATRQAGLFGLKGHRFRGGMRASLYNAMPQEGAERLLTVMKRFESQHA